MRAIFQGIILYFNEGEVSIRLNYFHSLLTFFSFRSDLFASNDAECTGNLLFND